MTQNGYETGRTTTEWHDALVKHGIIEKQQKAPTQDSIDTKIMWEEKEAEQYRHQHKTLEQLDELEDEIQEDTLDALRKKRMEEMKEKAALDKFGYIKQIGKPEYELEVTKASENKSVVCCLFMYGQDESRILLDCLEKVAAKFKNVKFVKIIGNECIENYPDKLCPTLVLYKNGDTIGKVTGLFPFGGKNGINAQIVEWQLAEVGILKTTLEENPRKFKMKRGNIVKKMDDENDDDDDSDSGLDID